MMKVISNKYTMATNNLVKLIAAILLVSVVSCTANKKELSIDRSFQIQKVSLVDVPVAPRGKIYFQQEFNSSTNFNDYVGVGKENKFDGLLTAGNQTRIEADGSRLRFIKNGGTGNQRAVAFRQQTPFNTTVKGGFLRFEIDVEVSNNSTQINNGFLFSVGKGMNIGGAADATVATIHSAFYVRPTPTPGAFDLKPMVAAGTTALPASEALEGAHKLVWYINNTGKPVGYNTPDNISQGSLMNDTYDVWAVDSLGKAMLMLDDMPALTPALDALQTFRLSNNDTFVATLDMDNLVLSEEPVVEVKTITKLFPLDPVSAPVKTLFSFLPLQPLVKAELEDGEIQEMKIRWSPLSTYYQYKVGEYDVRGDVVANPGTINADTLFLVNKVTLRANLEVPNSFSPNGDGINDTWLIPDLKSYSRTSVEIYDRDGRQLFFSEDPNVGWDGRNKNGQIISGAYLYLIKVPDLLLEKKGTVTLIK